MSGAHRPCADLDVRRRRLLFRSRHRGMREMDLILGSFVEADVAGLDEAEIGALERLTEVPDGELLSWIIGSAGPPQEHDTPLFGKLRAFHLRGKARGF